MTEMRRNLATNAVGTRSDSSTVEQELAERVARVQETIAAAAKRAGRDPGEVTLVAVSKTMSAERVAAAARLGLRHFGENRVQEADAKLAELHAILSPAERAELDWHLIGHLQTNKARLATTLFATIESVDSLRLATTLGRLGQERGAPVPVLLEVNVGGEPSKSGFRPEELPSIFGSIQATAGIDVRGLMTVAPIVSIPEEARPYFRALRALRDRLARENPGVSLPELSMGMTGDYAVAIEEGATVVRVGRAIFGEREG